MWGCRMTYYKIHKKDFWPLMAEVRVFYQDQHPTYTTMVPSLHSKIANGTGGYHHAMKRLSDTQLIVYLQLFDPVKPYWLAKVLEDTNHWSGWFANMAVPYFSPQIWPVRFDADAPKEFKANAHTLNWLERQLEAQRYMMVPLIDTDSLQTYFQQLSGASITKPSSTMR